MKRFLTVVAATAVAAAITIPAVADSGSPSDELGTFATCLRSHGIPVPTDLEGVAIKQWVGEHPDTPGLDAAFQACDPNPQGDKADAAAPQELVACLRNKGLTPPANLNDLKPWVLDQFKSESGKAALNACGLAAPEEKPAGGEDKKRTDAGPCGEDKAQPAAKASTSRARQPKLLTVPTT
jgi:hypothetical protein